jgi:hypothetical protein
MPEHIIPQGTGWDKNTERIEQDIEIGAVEIKDHNSDLRADVKTLSSGDNALVVETTPSATSIQNVRVQDGNGTGLADVKSDGVDNALVVTQNSQPLPTGAATEATLSDLNGKVTACDTTDIPKQSDTPTIQTVTLTLANTEYSITLPAGTKRFSMQPRTNVDVRFAFVTGKVAAPTEPYATMKSGAPYTEFDILSGARIYFASSTAGTVVEVVSWS